MTGRPLWAVGLLLSILGAALLVVVWADCLKQATNFLEQYISPILLPLAKVFGLSEGDVFRSANGACRKWWADSVWLVAVGFLVLGMGSLMADFYHLLTRLLKDRAR